MSIVKQGYEYKQFRWSQELKHEDVELTKGDTVACNPDGQWRSVKGDLLMANRIKQKDLVDQVEEGELSLTSKYYVRF